MEKIITNENVTALEVFENKTHLEYFLKQNIFQRIGQLGIITRKLNMLSNIIL